MITEKFLKNTKDLPPNRILLEAFPYIKDYANALDLGCGAFRDTRFLLEKGFVVDAVDNSPNVEWVEQENKNLHFFSQSFTEFTYLENKYDIVNAQYSIPFCDPTDFTEVWRKIANSLKSGGIFAGQLFGLEDSFAPDEKMTFLEKERVEELFQNFKIHTFVEAKRTSMTATGRQKFWHVFDVIGEKK